MTDYFDLSGKVALVTGGSRGLGYQMVKAFAVHGADVFITSRKLEACEKVAARRPIARTSAATFSQASSLRLVMKTSAPWAAKAFTIW